LGHDGLLYVSLPYNVKVYTYPKGKPFASISIPGGANGMCTDGVGNVFIIEGDGEVAEYAHGATKPTASKLLLGDPYSCAVDPFTGNLAVSNQGGAVEVFTKFPGKPTIYSLPATGNLYFCTYDGDGNLFVDGRWFQRHKIRNGLFELVKGGSSLTPVTLPFGIVRTAAAIQWDGKYLAIQALRNNHTFDRVSVHDFHGQVVSAVRLLGEPPNRSQFVIEDGSVIQPDALIKGIGFWRYPAGGAVKKRIKRIGDYVFGVAISTVAKERRDAVR